MEQLTVIEAGFQIPWLWIFGIGLVCAGAAWCVRKAGQGLIGDDARDLSFKEYSTLRDLEDAGYMWLARDYNGKLHTFNACPKRVKKMGIFHVWRGPEIQNIDVRVATLRKHSFPQVSKWRKRPYKISDMLY